MHITLPIPSTTSIRSLVSWHRLGIIAVFLIVLGLTIQITDMVISIVSPAHADDPAATQALLTEIAAQSLPANADLSALGYQLQEAPNAAMGMTVTAALAISPIITVTTSPVTTPTVEVSPTASETATPSLPSWDHKGRVNILLMGLDGNANQGRFRRADSLIVVSIDPATNSAVLIGIPRDLYVTINSPKGAIRNKINTAYVWGELYNYPGGGPALQMRTVGETLGLPIHHYIAVYFDGFAKLIDAIGGIDIDVPQAIRDNFTGWSFNTGMQHMDGKRALQYARSRYSTSDFSRGRRQQAVILAAVEKITKAGILPKLPAVLPTVTQAFRSDMSIPDLLALASLGYKIDRSTIKTAQIDETMCMSYRTPEGASALMPKWDRIRAMVSSALTPPTPVPTPTAPPATAPATQSAAGQNQSSTANTEAYRSEQAKIEILNGTNTVGLARRTQLFLQSQGLQVTRIADARGLYGQTILQDDGSKPATRDAIMKLLNIKPENVQKLGPAGVNMRIILGADARIP